MEASEILQIYVHEDDSVQRKLTKKAQKLQKKYFLGDIYPQGN